MSDETARIDPWHLSPEWDVDRPRWCGNCEHYQIADYCKLHHEHIEQFYKLDGTDDEVTMIAEGAGFYCKYWEQAKNDE